MEKFGCPSKFITIVRQLHDGLAVKVLDDGDESEAFPVTNGVKEGRVLAPTLFGMVFPAMLTDAFRDCQDGLRIRYRADDGLFNPRHMKAVTKVNGTIVRELSFADDVCLQCQHRAEDATGNELLFKL